MNGLTLESAEEALRRWRAQRSSRVELIPEMLWSMALGLYPQYNRSKICRLLRLSGGQFKERLEAGGPIPFRAQALRWPLKERLKQHPYPSPEIQLTLQGQTRSMTLCFDVHALDELPKLQLPGHPGIAMDKHPGKFSTFFADI